MLDREPNSGSWVIGGLRSKGGFLSTRRSHQIGAADSWNGKGSKTPPEDGYLLRINTPRSSGNRHWAGRSTGAPMEPPIGYGSTHRSIFPESQFGTTAAPCFRGPVAGSPNGFDAAAGARRDRRGGGFFHSTARLSTSSPSRPGSTGQGRVVPRARARSV
jgi:hypothetical protein